jgi:hypothetical protein
VGSFSTTGSSSPIILKWDGKTWAKQDLGIANIGSVGLQAVTAPSPNDVWAVGYYYPKNSVYAQTLTLHWSGTKWQKESGYDCPLKCSTYFSDVSAVSGTNLWGSDISTRNQVHIP